MLLDTPEQVKRCLEQAGLIAAGDPVVIDRLAGGVSCSVWKAVAGPQRWVIKQALAKLNVEAEWYSDVSRINVELSALEALNGILPAGAVPGIVYADPVNYWFVMTCAPEGSVTWKEQLMQKRFEPSHAFIAGSMLRNIHDGSRQLSATLRNRFEDTTYFKQLRIEPFHLYLADKHPDLRGSIHRLVDQLTETRDCLVHGDYSPKNMLVAPNDSMVLLDFEVAHWGCPLFDVAYCLGHLMLKGWALNAKSEVFRLIDRFLEGYGLDTSGLQSHLGLMLLARLEGKSPVDYVKDEILRRKITEIVVRWLKSEDDSVSIREMIIDAWKE